MIIVAGIDPGSRECGWALADVQTSTILAAGLARNPDREGNGAGAWLAMAQAVAKDIALRRAELELPAPSLLVVERQWLGKRERSEGNEAGGTRNPYQILNLAYAVGCVLAVVKADRKLAIWPSQWKGGSTKGKANKAKVNAQLWAQLSPAERGVAEKAETWQGHNVKDSIGITRWAAGRYRFLLATKFAGFED